MQDQPGWYPPGQVCYPPELPTYLKNIYDLKPIVGVPSDDEVIGIHTVIQTANRVLGVPGMHDSGLFMKLADHLFSVQMIRYRSKYSLVIFPSDATYTPPTLPSHISVQLEPISGAPSDEEMTKVQDALQTYQEFRRIPSMFDERVNMELSQHLFDIQMARYMRLAGESQPRAVSQAFARSESPPVQITERTPRTAGDSNNAGTGSNPAGVNHGPHLVSGTDVCELMGRSNQLAERFNVLLERSNTLVEQSAPPTEQSSPLAERLDQVLERLTQLLEHVHQPAESDRLSERFNQLLGRFNQIVEQSNLPVQQSNEPAERPNQLVEQPRQPVQQSNHLAERFNQLFEQSNQLLSQITQPMQYSNQLAERLNQLLEGFNQPLQRSNQLSERANELAEQLNQSFERSNQLSEKKPTEQLQDVLRNMNKVLVGVQHAIVRNHKGNTLDMVDCLVNEKGETPGVSETTLRTSFGWLSERHNDSTKNRIPVRIDGTSQALYLPDRWLGEFLRFHGIGEGLCQDGSSELIEGKANIA